MKGPLKYALIACAALVAAPSAMADEKARFESDGFLQSLDLFITNRLNSMRQANTVPKSETGDDLKLSLRDAKAGQQSGYISLNAPRDSQSEIAVSPERPDFSSLLAPNGFSRGTQGRELMGTSSSLDLAFGSEDAIRDNRAFQIGVNSNYRLSQSIFSTSAADSSSLFDREVNVGMSVGYYGFNLDASYVRSNSILTGDGLGYDIGFSYTGDSWSARLSLSEYKKGADLVGLENQARNIISVELGASYKLTSALGLQGGVRVYDYGNRVLFNPEEGEKSKMIFLGGRLTF